MTYTENASARQGMPRATIETVLWILVAIIALALRLASLGAAPLNSHEAHEAMLAWRAVTGQGMPEASYSPLLFVVNGLLFFLCGASDELARLWPTVFGGALVLTPFLFRRRVGRVGALVAGLCLAFSPIALVASRQLDGAIPAAAGGMAFLGGATCFFDTERRSWLVFSAVGLALAVTASPLIYGMLLVVGLAWLSLSWAWPGPNGEMWRLWKSVRPHLRYVLVGFLCVGFALSTGLGWNLPGVGAAGGLLVDWFARFISTPNPVASPLTLLTVYEPLALLFGLGGLVWAIRRGHRFGVLLGLWAGLGTLLLILMPGRAPTDMLWVVLPLTLLVGLVLAQVVSSLQTTRAYASEWLYALVVLLLWAYFYLRLARYTTVGSSLDLFLALLSLVLQILMAAVFTIGLGTGNVLRAGIASLGVVLLAVIVAVGWGAAYVRPADPRELLIQEPTAIEVHDLVQTLHDLSWHRTGEVTTLPFLFEASPDSVLAWYLRDFSAARRVESATGIAATDAVLVTTARQWPSADSISYVGQDFVLHRSWNPAETNCVWTQPVQCSTATKWLLFRTSPSLPVPDQWIVLWLRRDNAFELLPDNS